MCQDERSLRLLQATASTRQSLELGSAILQRGADTAPVARDAQLVGPGTSLTAITIEPGAPRELVVSFEASPTMPGPGLKMVLSPAGSRVELPLE